MGQFEALLAGIRARVADLTIECGSRPSAGSRLQLGGGSWARKVTISLEYGPDTRQNLPTRSRAQVGAGVSRCLEHR